MMLVRPMTAVVAIALVAACATSPTTESTARRQSVAGLCSANETPLFQCHVGSKQVAVCGGRSASGHTYAQYRSGQPGALDQSYPTSRDGGAGTMVRALIPYSGGGEAQFHFTDGGDQYVVYSGVVRTGFSTTNNPSFSAGVIVRRNGRTLSDRGCSDGDTANVDLAAAEPFIPQGEAVESD